VILLDLLLGAAGAVVFILCAYLALLALLARRPPAAAAIAPRFKFEFVVPAHNEAGGIAETVTSLLSVDYPRELLRVTVVADNCQDDTAARAGQAGARVLVRQSETERGKGYALDHAFTRVLAEGFADAIVVVDADTVVAANLLTAFSARLALGAQAMQTEYAVRNPEASWRTRLMVIAFALFHGVRSFARERLRLSCGLRGNGMCFSTDLLRAHPYRAFSIVEDVEYGLALGYAGQRVYYVGESEVRGEMVASEAHSRSQRARWEGGRLALARTHVPRLLPDAVRGRSRVLLDLAFDLLVPPLSTLCLLAVVGTAFAGFRLATGGPGAPLILWLASGACLLFYVLRGWALSGVGLRGLVDLAWAPVYVLWKLTLRFRGGKRSPAEWVRTTREQGEG
jgi:1,2-diacylglycerol 3-beta-glucosyltransferase